MNYSSVANTLVTVSSKKKPTDSYIPAIDGLRALAVLAVILFHSAAKLIPGGFTGVDVFFAISGYVVSKSLHQNGSKSFSMFAEEFYSRRIYRIAPALIACLLGVTLLNVLFVPHSWLSSLTVWTGLTAFVGLSNVALLFQDAYFSPTAEYNSFVHTWTLAVEEQFYIVLPLFLYCWIVWSKRGSFVKAIAWTILPALSLLSVFIAVWMTSSHPKWAFYLLPARFWELAAGAFLYEVHSQGRGLLKSQHAASIGLGIGLGIIIAGLEFSRANGFPWPWALFPVVGTLICLASVVEENARSSILHRLMQSWPIGYIGRISYSLYLWHWPVLTLFRWTIGLDTILELFCAWGLTCSVSIASYHLVERPFRRPHALEGRSALFKVSVGLATIASASVLSAAIFLSRGFLSLSVTRDAATWYARVPSVRGFYPKNHIFQPGSSEGPLSGKHLFVIGDSHTRAYLPMLFEAAQQLGISVDALGFCPVGNSLYPIKSIPGCSETLNEMFRMLNERARPGDLVFFSSLRTPRLSREWGELDLNAVIYSVLSPESEAQRISALDETAEIIKSLEEMGLIVVIDAPTPVFLAPAFRCSDWFNKSNPICRGGLDVSRTVLLEIRKPIMRSIAELERRFENVHVWDPFPILCPGPICSPYDKKNGKPLFFDGDHLSGYGNKELYPDFRRLLIEILTTKKKTNL